MIWIFIVPIALLLIGLADLPTGYYTIVRIVVCLVSCLSCYSSYCRDRKIGIATLVYAALALLFNPIIPIYLQDKEVWTVIDIVAAILLGIKYFGSLTHQQFVNFIKVTPRRERRRIKVL